MLHLLQKRDLLMTFKAISHTVPENIINTFNLRAMKNTNEFETEIK